MFAKSMMNEEQLYSVYFSFLEVLHLSRNYVFSMSFDPNSNTLFSHVTRKPVFEVSDQVRAEQIRYVFDDI